jgi:CubicO group peptidase (beta-lactamase class C family)
MNNIVSSSLIYVCLCLLAVICFCFETEQTLAQEPPKVWPGTDWERVDRPESLGYSSPKLEALRSWLKTQRTTAMHVSVDGKVIFEYGDLARVSKVASVRKSILSMLYGKYVIDGTIDINKTVKQLGLDDVKQFLPIEERATLEHLLTARSGIYHPSGNQELDVQAPSRGSQYPGVYFLYNNWDFNAAGTAFERLTKKDIYDALEADLARPIQMQDFDRARQKKIPATPTSVHPEYAMYLSTRDMARLGLLMLREGNWKGKQLVPRDWCKYTTSIVTPFHEINPPSWRQLGQPERWGYGVMWWVWDAPVWPGGVSGSPFQGAYSAKGAGGQFITVLPRYGMVIAHKVDIDNDSSRNVTALEYETILLMIISCVDSAGR